MSQINLLPWREERRKQKTTEFGALAAVVGVGAILIVAGARIHAGNLASYQTSRNQYLENEIKTLDTKLQEIEDLETTKQNLLARMNIIQELQRSRPEIVHLFEEVVTTIPEGVWLDEIKQSAKTLNVAGRAESNARVSAYMRNVEASAWMKDPVLTVIEAEKDGRNAKFNLTLRQESTAISEEEEAAAAKPDPKAKGKKGKPDPKAKAKAKPKAKKQGH
jgi:type IV pilus assembly protein PilN